MNTATPTSVRTKYGDYPVLVCPSASKKMRSRGLQEAFIPTALMGGDWFHDPLDSNIMHVCFHGHDVICRERNGGIFVITVNMHVSRHHGMRPLQRLVILPKGACGDTADTSNNWRMSVAKPVSKQVETTHEVGQPAFKNVLAIAERIMASHDERRWVRTTIK